MTYTPTEQANIDAIRAMLAHEARQDWDAVYELVTDDCVTTMGNVVLRGKAEMREYDAKYFIPVFASSARTILDIAADGDAVIFRWRADAVLKADGRSLSWEGVSWCRVRDGKAAEGHIYLDSAEVQRQMRPPREATP
ncbi:MAG: nuclear transport factor 2 family protein [Dehalococcoidia bacterium]|nr:nuclear transport factor 2 family protein [Dehalococcoidia bacterium]